MGVVTALVGKAIIDVGVIVGLSPTSGVVLTIGVAVATPTADVPPWIASAVPVAKFCTSVMFVGCGRDVLNRLPAPIGVSVTVGASE